MRPPLFTSVRAVDVTVVAVMLGDDVVRVSVAGEIDLGSAPGFSDALVEAAGSWPGRRVLVSLAGVRFLNASGVRVLVTVHRRLADAGRELVVVDAQPIVCEVLRITGVLHLLAPDGVQEAPATRRA